MGQPADYQYPGQSRHAARYPQGPEDFSSRITANGIDIDFSGTILLRTLPDNMMQFIVLNGSGVSGGLSVSSGFTMAIALGVDPQVDGPWTGMRPGPGSP